MGIIVIGFAAVFAIILRKLKEMTESKDDKGLLLIQQQLNQVSEQLNKGLVESTKTIQEQFRSSAGIIKDVTEKLTKLEDTNKQVVGIADQLQGLEYILKNPKQRVILGDYYLETLLKNIFHPNQYQMQYQFRNGEIVDAAIFIKDKILPIDSKFSLEKYNKILEEKDAAKKEILQRSFKQDLKNRIDETSKYIRPKEGTMDFAFLFIPSEGIYYDLLVNQVGTLKVNTRDLIEYEFKERKVIIVSPTSFAAYLQTVLQGLRALSIEESIKEIVVNIQNLGKHMNSYETYLKKVGSNLSTTVNSYNGAYKEFSKIDKEYH
jgi:DNA recombination protein RmuC